VATTSRHPAFCIAATALAVTGVMSVATPVRAQQSCGTLPPPSGPTIQVAPSQAGDLRGIVAAAEAGTTILLENGTYDLSNGDGSSRLSFDTANVTLRSLSGDRNGVILDGAYGTSEIISISASDVTIADLTVMRTYTHPIHISGQPGNPISGILIHNLRIVDPREQAIKVNPVGDGYVDNSTIECCSIELTDTGRTHVNPIPGGCYTGGIDVHQAQGWVVRRNRIEGFWCDTGLSEHGIHFWQCCRDTLVEENVIVDCARGIGFGLNQTGSCRTYPDDPYPTVGFKDHIDGIIRNNFVAAADTDLLTSPDGFDTGIAVTQAYGAKIVHNSVASTSPPFTSIEWRFPNSVVEISNNVVTKNLLQRDGATATLGGNIVYAPLNWFTDVTVGDLHLTANAASAIDAGISLVAGLCEWDIDGRPRDATPDVGADEIALPAIFSDGFEPGDTSAWSSAVP
jgi:hypothetical protein